MKGAVLQLSTFSPFCAHLPLCALQLASPQFRAPHDDYKKRETHKRARRRLNARAAAAAEETIARKYKKMRMRAAPPAFHPPALKQRFARTFLSKCARKNSLFNR